MKRFVRNIFIFFVVMAVIDVCYGVVFDCINAHSKGGDNKRMYNICKKDKYDILVMGSSRAHHHYVPSIIEDSTGMNCYNAGFDGNGIILAYGILQQIIKRYRPKLIIYDVEPAFDIEVYEADNNRTRYLSFLRPFYKDQNVANVFKDISYDEYCKVHSGLYRYNSTCITSLISCIKSIDQDTQYGYAPLFGKMTKEPLQPLPFPHSIDAQKIKYIEKIIELATNYDIPIVFVASPKYKKESSDVFEGVKGICSTHKVPFFDFYHPEEFMNHKEYFKEPMHLNDVGAQLFTKQLISKINNIPN